MTPEISFFSTPQNNFNLRDDPDFQITTNAIVWCSVGSFEAPRDGKENGFQRALRGL